jgi:Icc-related predicted phosphoesterase
MLYLRRVKVLASEASLKILFTSDLHGKTDAFEDFLQILDSVNYDCGVIAGDLLDDGVTKEEAMDLLGIVEDDLLPELAYADESYEETLQRQIEELHKPTSYLMQTLTVKERALKELLSRTRKPIFVIKGNHDMTDWASYKNIHNIHGRKVSFRGYSFIGYQFTEFERTEEKQRACFQQMRKHIDPRTILVTHIAAKGTLDHSIPGYCNGSRALRELLQQTKPLLHLHGHIHERFGWEGRSVNGAYPSERRFIRILVGGLK